MAGGGAYYFAKGEINKDRAAKHEAMMRQRALQESLEYSSNIASRSSSASKIGSATEKNIHREDTSAVSPSQEATSDPAPTRHAPENDGQKILEKSKYEAAEPYRTRKGDRFS